MEDINKQKALKNLKILEDMEKRKGLRTRYINIDGRILMQQQLNLMDMAVLGIIFSGCQNNQSFQCDLSYKFIAELTHTSERQVMRTVQKLIQLNYITKDNKALVNEKTPRNTYYIDRNTSELFSRFTQEEADALRELNRIDKMSYLRGDNLSDLIKENKKEILDYLIKDITNDDETFKELKNAIEEEVKYREFVKNCKIVKDAAGKWIE